MNEEQAMEQGTKVAEQVVGTRAQGRRTCRRPAAGGDQGAFPVVQGALPAEALARLCPRPDVRELGAAITALENMVTVVTSMARRLLTSPTPRLLTSTDRG